MWSEEFNVSRTSTSYGRSCMLPPIYMYVFHLLLKVSTTWQMMIYAIRTTVDFMHLVWPRPVRNMWTTAYNNKSLLESKKLCIKFPLNQLLLQLLWRTLSYIYQYISLASIQFLSWLTSSGILMGHRWPGWKCVVQCPRLIPKQWFVGSSTNTTQRRWITTSDVEGMQRVVSSH